MKRTGHVAREGEKKTVHKSLVSQRKWNRSFRGLRPGLEDNTRQYIERVTEGHTSQ